MNVPSGVRTNVSVRLSNRFVVPYQPNLLSRYESERPEVPLEAPPHERVQPVGRDDDVEPRELVERSAPSRPNSHLHAGRARPLLKELEQREPPDGGEPDPVDPESALPDARA